MGTAQTTDDTSTITLFTIPDTYFAAQLFVVGTAVDNKGMEFLVSTLSSTRPAPRIQ